MFELLLTFLQMPDVKVMRYSSQHFPHMACNADVAV